jgi:hypothetical protein
MAEVEIKNKLLKEAIADAETLVATAVENAKLSLEETFTPQIKSMIERKLRAQADEVPHEDGEPEGSSEMPADTSDIGDAENKEPSDDAFDTSDLDSSGEDAGESKTDWYEDWSDSDFDLDEVIKELEEDVDMLNVKDKDEESEEEDEEKSEEESEEESEEDEEKSEEESEEDGEYPEGEPAGEEGEEPPADSSKIGKMGATKFTLDEFLGMMEEAGFNLGLTGVAPAAEPPMEEVEQVKETDLNLEEILAMLEAEDASIQEDSVSEEMTSEMKELQQELAESRQAIQILRGKLNEVNLLNAKLLFTNKVFRKPGLTNEQKVMVVENFDRATTVREVKMVYAVLAESLTADVKSKTVKTQRKIMAEGLASKATPSTAPKQEIIAENSVAKRLQQLAGIIS